MPDAVFMAQEDVYSSRTSTPTLTLQQTQDKHKTKISFDTPVKLCLLGYALLHVRRMRKGGKQICLINNLRKKFRTHGDIK